MSDLLCNLLDAQLHASGKVILEELGEVGLPAALAGGHVLQVHGPGEGGVRWRWGMVLVQGCHSEPNSIWDGLGKYHFCVVLA